MDGIIYNWKVDFALIMSILSFLFTLLKWYFESNTKKKKSVLDAYERVYTDAMFILLHPLNCRKEKSLNKEYSNFDPELEKSVRDYLNSHFLSRLFDTVHSNTPNNIKDETEKLKYFKKVYEEAEKFENEIMNEQLKLDIPSLSPVYYFDNDDIMLRFKNIIECIGKSLSLFSSNVQKFWSDTLTSNPDQVRKDYKLALEVCPNFFIHNSRDFSDPYYDLLVNIKKDYNKLTQKRFESFGWELKIYIKKILHPVKSYKNYKENKSFLR